MAAKFNNLGRVLWLLVFVVLTALFLWNVRNLSKKCTFSVLKTSGRVSLTHG